MPLNFETLVAELERPRHLTPQVMNHLIEAHDLDREAVGPFLTEKLPDLEDYEIDLILSPLFTPTLNEQAVFAEQLGRESVPAAQWSELIRRLEDRPIRGHFVTEDDSTHVVPLRAVTIERFVHRLRLDGTMAESLFDLIQQRLPAADRPILKAIARRAVWERESRQEILARWLTQPREADTYRLDDAVALLHLMETYEPADTAELLARIPHWQQVLRQEINDVSGSKPFFNERVEELHGGGRDQRRQDNARLSAKREEQEFLERLARTLSD